jgi:hypothetical protein
MTSFLESLDSVPSQTPRFSAYLQNSEFEKLKDSQSSSVVRLRSARQSSSLQALRSETADDDAESSPLSEVARREMIDTLSTGTTESKETALASLCSASCHCLFLIFFSP